MDVMIEPFKDKRDGLVSWRVKIKKTMFRIWKLRLYRWKSVGEYHYFSDAKFMARLVVRAMRLNEQKSEWEEDLGKKA